MGQVPSGIGSINRCRSHLRYKKTKKLKISKFGLTPFIKMWAVEGTRSSYIHYTALFSMKGVTPILAFRVNEGNVKPVFFLKNRTFEFGVLGKRRKTPRCLRSDNAGEGDGGGGGFPLPAPQGKF